MDILIICIFVLGYLAIAFEHSIKIDKAASSLLIGMVCWAIYALNPFGFLQINPNTTPVEQAHLSHEKVEHLAPQTQKATHFIQEQMHEFPEESATMSDYVHRFVEHGLSHHLFEIASILFFLIGAMTIVELVDAHDGFSVITDKITTKNPVKLLWVVSIITFFFSAALDNLTTSIVMISVLRKLIEDKKMRWFFAGFVVLSANAGGAWSPIGDVTTTMLWIGKQLPNTQGIIFSLILPSLVCMIVPLVLSSFLLKGEISRPQNSMEDRALSYRERLFFFMMGLFGLLFVPAFKTITHLPPFMGMMLSLGVIWMITETINHRRPVVTRDKLSPLSVLRKIDTASVLFFLGILLAVAALQEIGHLALLSEFLNEMFDGNIYGINIVIGFLSSIVDNVPLVAAAQGMYSISLSGPFASNGAFWEFLAYCAGTGGSSLIIGSAAGVAVMGIEKIPFGWYLKKISLLAVVGYVSGALVYIFIF